MKTRILIFGIIMGIFQFSMSQTAKLQIIHNSADAAAASVDIYVNGVIYKTNVGFRTATPFETVPAGVPLTIDIAPAPSTSVLQSVYNTTVTLTASETYVVVANGIVSPTGYTPATAFNLYVYPMGRETASVSTEVDLMVFHGATDAPSVDVKEITLGGATIISDMAYGDFTGYLSLPVNDYGLQILPHNQSVVVAEYLAPLSSLNLDGLALTVVASGFLDPSVNSNGPGFGLWVALPTGGALVELPALDNARLQVIHNSADLAAEEVDVYLNGNLLLDDFAFRTATPFIDIAAGLEHVIAVAPSTSTSVNDAIADFTVEFDANETYVVIANGIVSPSGYTPSAGFDLYVYPMGRETASVSTEVDLMVFHGATDAPSVDVNEITLGGATIISDMAYGDFTGYLSLPVNDYGLQILPHNQSVVVAEYLAPLSSLNLDGLALTVVASGFLDPSVNSNGPGFGLWVALPTGGALVELPALDNARLQVIHNSADLAAEEVDVYLNGNLLLDDFAFRTATPFIDIAAGLEHVIAVAPSTSTSVNDAIADFTVEFDANETYVVIANGIVSPSGYTPSAGFDLYVYPMGRETASVSTEVDLMVFHGATDAPSVDVNEITLGGATIISDMAYGDFTGYLSLPVNDYGLQILPHNQSVVVAEYLAPLSSLNLDGLALTVIASGFLDPSVNSNGPGFGLWVALPTGGALVELPALDNARLQVIHNSADLAAEEVDVYLNGNLLLDDFAFRTATPFIDIAAGLEHVIAVAPSTSTSVNDAIADFTVEFDANETYVVIANGIVSPSGYTPSAGFDLYVYPMGRETASVSTEVDLMVFHGATDAPSVDVNEITLGGATIISDMAYGDFTGYLSLPVNDYGLQILPHNQSVVVAEYLAPLSSLNLDGLALTVVASGFLDPSVNSNGPGFGLWVALPTGGALVELPALDNARLQVIHNSADLAAEEVDVYLNGNLLLDDFAFRTATPFIDIAAGLEHEIAVAPSTSTSVNDAIAQYGVTFDANETYVVVANGIVSSTGYTPAVPFNLHVFAGARENSSNMNTTDVLVFHGATDAPAVDIVETAMNAGTLVDDLPYAVFAGYLDLAVNDYQVDIRPAGQPTTVASFGVPLQTLNLGGEALVVVASGFLSPSDNSNGPAFGLWVALPAGGNLIPLPVTTSVESYNMLSDNVRVYPNPVTDFLTIETTEQNYSAYIVDMNGRTVMQMSFDGDNSVDVSQLSAGAYLLNLVSENGSHTERIIINR
jgi:hypothetical protein